MLRRNLRGLKGAHGFVAGGDDREHAKVVLEGRLLRLHGGGGDAVLDRVHAVPQLVRGSHRRFDAAIREKPAQHNVPDPVLTQQKVQVCRGKATQTDLALDDQISLFRFHFVANVGTPFASSEGGTVANTGQDPVRVLVDFVVSLSCETPCLGKDKRDALESESGSITTIQPLNLMSKSYRLEGDGTVDDGAPSSAQRVGELDRVVQHVGLGHDILHGIVELAARRRELVLVLDQNESRFGGVQHEGGGDRR